MPIWKVPVEWGMVAILNVEADTLEEAVERAENDTSIPIPMQDGEYMDDSFRVEEIDVEEIRSWYNDGMPDDVSDTPDAVPDLSEEDGELEDQDEEDLAGFFAD